MGPVLSAVNHDGVQPYLHGTKTQKQAWQDGTIPLKSWMLAQTRKDDLGMLTRLSAQAKNTAASSAGQATSTDQQKPAQQGTLTAPAATPPSAAPNNNTVTPGKATAASTETAAKTDPASISMTTLVPAFILSELKSAFILGFVIFIPFLIIDIVVSSSLMSMGMAMVPPITVSLPFKILLFLMVDGWGLIIHSVITSYH
jgi:flagellar biosynthetic protein FliP